MQILTCLSVYVSSLRSGKSLKEDATRENEGKKETDEVSFIIGMKRVKRKRKREREDGRERGRETEKEKETA